MILFKWAPCRAGAISLMRNATDMILRMMAAAIIRSQAAQTITTGL